MMKILETIVRTVPAIENGRLRLSADSGIWFDPDDLGIVERLCLNKFQEEITTETFGVGGYQLKSKDQLQEEIEGVFLGFLAVTEEYYNYYVLERDEVVPSADLYDDISDSLELLGFDVCDHMMLSAFSHGSSPYYGGYGDFGMINMYGLFETFSDAFECANRNDQDVTEHSPWSPVGIYVTKESNKILRSLLEE